MDRSLGRLWPRAQSKLYEEPKKLVEQGLAEARSEPVGQRPRTVYAITPEGRRALAAWLREPGTGPVLEPDDPDDPADARPHREVAEDLVRRASW